MASNGQLPDGALAPIAQGRLETHAAAGWNAMNAESRKRGLELLPTGSMSSYRTLEQQKILYARYLNGGNLAARPGTSNHGWGLAVDVATQQMRSMVDAIGAKYGWAKAWSDAPSEWWHLKYEAGHYSGPDPGPHGTAKAAAPMIVMYDSIDVSQIPASAEAVAGYTSGNWPTYPELVKKFPNAHVLSIAVNAGQRARCLDVEPGDASNGEAPGWYQGHADRSQGLPVLYTSASNVNALVSTMTSARIFRDQYYIWSAHYTFNEHICSPGGCGYPQADATQWTDKAQGKNLDQSACQPYFFGVRTPLPTPPEDTMAISVGSNADGRLAVFVELSSGEVKHIEQTKPNGDWWKDDKGHYNWLTLGKP